jgi:ATP-dependent helicase/nuclease subunit A
LARSRRPPPDQAFRDQIVGELGRTMLVEAGAGTGKTTCLVARMVGLLRMGHCQIETMAAITFTRKATAELRTRFQSALEKASRDANDTTERDRLVAAHKNVDRCFIGTIHSFCARLLRERPVEAGVEPGFIELDEDADLQLRLKAWREHLATLVVKDDRVLPELQGLGLKVSPAKRRSRSIVSELDELGLEPAELGPAFLRFAEFADIEDWPAETVPLPDLSSCIPELIAYAERMRDTPLPADFGSDRLMPKYDLIGRMARRLDVTRPAAVMEVLEHFHEFDRRSVVQRNWPGGKDRAIEELECWNQFVYQHADPILVAWREHRYEPVMRAIRPALDVYGRLRSERGSLNFQDLLIRSVILLRDHPDVRVYFRERITHLLVDEFQDTDPLQAEVMLLLTSDDTHECDWRKCRPVPGSLFVVGDPKQSIYRFRRADIVTYNKVRFIIEAVGGAVIPLTANFRSVRPLIEWVNECFSRVFPAEADDFNPADRPLQVGRQDGVETGNSAKPSANEDAADPLSFDLEVGELEPEPIAPASNIDSRTQFGKTPVERLLIPDELSQANEIAEYEADLIARTIRKAIDGRWLVTRTDGERSLGLPNYAIAGDFMIVARYRARLAIYARALQRYGILYAVSGGGALNEIPELELLYICLKAVVRSDDPVALVSVLRSELFGVADTLLYDFRRLGGQFSYRSAIPADLDKGDAVILSDAFDRLSRYYDWLTRTPTSAAIERIAADLGLIARAAAGEQGHGHAGSFLKAFELLRVADQSWTAADYVEALGRLVEKDEPIDGVPVRPPLEMPVRVMNLHQCKGLEATFVFLVDPSGEWDHEVDIYVDRSGTRSQGYLPVYGRRRTEYSAAPLLSQPREWDVYAAKERQFLEAEATRLLYVAATRAGSKLVISQREEKNSERNPWRLFARDLQAVPILPDPGQVTTATPDEIAVELDGWDREVETIEHRWQSILTPTFRADSGGSECAGVLHTMLEVASQKPKADLQYLAASLLQHEELPQLHLSDIVAKTTGILKSDLWRRAQSAVRVLIQVPISVLQPASEGLPTRVHSVIDLAFKEKSGWVIVDCKPDRIDASRIPELVDRYRPPLESRAKGWQNGVGELVVECGILFTHLGIYVALSN